MELTEGETNIHIVRDGRLQHFFFVCGDKQFIYNITKTAQNTKTVTVTTVKC